MVWVLLLLLGCGGDPVVPEPAPAVGFEQVVLTRCPPTVRVAEDCAELVTDTVYVGVVYRLRVTFSGAPYLGGVVSWVEWPGGYCPNRTEDGRCFQFGVWQASGTYDIAIVFAVATPHRIELVAITQPVGGQVVDRYRRDLLTVINPALQVGSAGSAP